MALGHVPSFYNACTHPVAFPLAISRTGTMTLRHVHMHPAASPGEGRWHAEQTLVQNGVCKAFQPMHSVVVTRGEKSINPEKPSVAL
jgi:hypothetical protein